MVGRAERVLARAKRTASGCLEYQGYRMPKGYGLLSGVGEQLAHRIAWVHHHGPIPDGLFVCHACDNPPCIEVTHLFLGTSRENMQDAANKGRMVLPPVGVGEEHGRAVLSDDKVREIRALHEAFVAPSGTKYGALTYLARRFGVGKSQISRVVNRQQWSHVQ